ncbi:NADH dehydrogenase (quinone) [Pedobacter sp. BAL39]|nr:NADH dehydrogenase (quinone) [Pedobacter sp. BAL39]
MLLLDFNKRWPAFLVSLYPATLTIYFLSYLPGILYGETLNVSQPWIPSLQTNLDFRLDGLSMLFTLLITGIGTLICLYAAAYMRADPKLRSFYAYLCVFITAMLGLVLSDNLILLFIFWELTSISSFFLIGFKYEDPASRKSALIALAVTGGGGFMLLSGFLLIGSMGQHYSIQHLLSYPPILTNDSLYPLILVFIFAGAFSKSAQFPLHFWLPGAMKAPSPVSAYLHSATMVKAGVYLLARLSPLLGNQPYWNYTLMTVGGFTMLYAAFHALFRTDLKAILAYSTLSALGMMFFLLGIGTELALLSLVTFIVVHALYKAAMFLITGVIDHETKTRDITKLGGLRKVLLPLAIAGVLAALSSAGIPFTFGFIGKELIYETSLAALPFAFLLTAAVLVANILLGYAGFISGIRPFFGELSAEHREVKTPSFWMWAPPLLLAFAGILFGAFPVLSQDLLHQAANSIGASTPLPPLKLWHGFSPVLLLSVFTILAATAMYLFLKPSTSRLQWVSRFENYSPKAIISGVAAKGKQAAASYTHTLQNGYLRIYVMIIMLFLIALICCRIFDHLHFDIDIAALTPIGIYEVVVTALIIVAIGMILFTHSRLASIIAMSIVGYGLCLIFVFYGAPDLAMTQFTIDTLTVVLFMIVLLRLPAFLNLSNLRIKIRDGLISAAFGLLISVIALMVLQEPTNKEISRFYADNAYPLAKGKNVVNVILVDFRGSDTMVEITVLTIAAIGVYSMLKLKMNPSEKE